MKITRVHIDQFSGWADTTLDLPDADLHVLYGPNETGKSTLLRFVRGVLYGFSERDRFPCGAAARPPVCAGHFCVTHRDEHYVIHREGTSRAGVVRLTDAQGGDVPVTVLTDLLGGVDSATFQNVFALGLPELQEVSTLAADEIASHIYHVSLGPTGRRLIDAMTEARRRKALLLNEDGSEGTVVSAATQISDLDEQIARCGDDVRRHEAIRAELLGVEAELQDQKSRQQGLASQLRGHEFMDRIAGPWKRMTEISHELEQLPRVAHIPEGGIERLDEFEREIEDLTQRNRDLTAGARELARSAAALNADSRLAEHASTVRMLLERRPEYQATQSRLSGLREDVELARLEADDAVLGLGENWDEQRTASVDGTPDAAIRLARAARRYGELLKRRKREVRRYQQVASRLQQRQAELAQQLRESGTPDAAEALESYTRQLTLLETAASDEVRAQALRQTRDELAAVLSAHEETRLLPPYFFGVLIAFGVLGLVLLVAGVIGLVQGMTGHTPWLVGLILTLLGAACGGITWSTRRQLEPDGRRDEPLSSHLQLVTTQLSDLESAVAENRRASAAVCSNSGQEDRGTAEALEVVRNRLSDLERLARHEDAVKARRISLSRFRERIRETQRTVSAARRDWCRTLHDLGLDESVRIDAPLEQWRDAAEAARKLAYVETVDDRLRNAEHTAGQFRAAVFQLARELDDRDAASEDVEELLADWERRLAACEAMRRQRGELRRESRRKRRAAAEVAEQLSVLKRQRLEHLVAAGAADREEFQERVEAHLRRQDLESEAELVNEELRRAAESEPDLAIVEEDLRAFEPAANRAAIDAIRDELADLSADVSTGHERVGRLREELRQIESDRRPAGLRFDRAQLRHQLAETLQALCSLEFVTAALDHSRHQLELEHQPQTLQGASGYLSRLTGEAYCRVWTRLGERRLLVDAGAGGALDVEQLSAGTREQLFLAIRLALIDQLRGQGVQLPVVLDDVLVNFDEERTEAAVRTLCDVAATGQQILVFTCHQHLAERFRTAGVSTIALPQRATGTMRRRVG